MRSRWRGGGWEGEGEGGVIDEVKPKKTCLVWGSLSSWGQEWVGGGGIGLARI